MRERSVDGRAHVYHQTGIVARRRAAPRFSSSTRCHAYLPAITDDQHPDHQLGSDRRATHRAIERREFAAQFRQLDKAVDRPQQMTRRYVRIEREVLEQHTCSICRDPIVIDSTSRFLNSFNWRFVQQKRSKSRHCTDEQPGASVQRLGFGLRSSTGSSCCQLASVGWWSRLNNASPFGPAPLQRLHLLRAAVLRHGTLVLAVLAACDFSLCIEARFSRSIQEPG